MRGDVLGKPCGTLHRSSVALRVSREVRRAVLGPVLSPFGNLAMSTFVGEMCRV